MHNKINMMRLQTELTACVSAAVCNRQSERRQVNHFLCMDLTYITCLLKDGFGFKESTVLQVRPSFWAVWSTRSSRVNADPAVSTADQEGEERGNQLGFGCRDQPLPEVQDSLNHWPVQPSSLSRWPGRISPTHFTSRPTTEKASWSLFLIKRLTVTEKRTDACDPSSGVHVWLSSENTFFLQLRCVDGSSADRLRHKDHVVAFLFVSIKKCNVLVNVCLDELDTHFQSWCLVLSTNLF